MTMSIPDNERALALRLFDRLDVSDPGNGDLLFNIFGVGNTVESVDRPYERFRRYEELLLLLRGHNATRYDQIHKGTAFWFLSWLAFDLRNYPKALFYMDAAGSEDLRRAPHCWLTEPAGAFLTLSNPAERGPGWHVGRLRGLLSEQIARFNGISSEAPLTVDDIAKKFVTKLLAEPRHRTIVSAWYLHLLEFEERRTDLTLRSSLGGSIEPFLDYLLRGGLILESLLKTLYSAGAATRTLRTLGAIYNSDDFKRDFGSGFATTAHDVKEILGTLTGGQIRDAFTVSAQVRNTTGHNLVWDDAFTDPSAFSQMFEFETNAMLFVVLRKFL